MPTTYRQKKIAHKEHLMATYPDGNYRFCRYFGCGYTEAWSFQESRWIAFPARRRKPANQILRMDAPRQAEMFPMSNQEAAQAMVRGRRSRRRAS